MFRKKKTKQTTDPIKKGLYAWNYVHAGSFLLYVESTNNCHKFLFLPGPTDYFLTPEDFQTGIRDNVLEFVEALPDKIFEEAISLGQNKIIGS